MNMHLPVFENDANSDTVIAALRRTGAAVIENVLDALRDAKVVRLVASKCPLWVQAV